jgi:hypothetical protein
VIYKESKFQDARKDIIRYITDQANADGKVGFLEEVKIDLWSLNILVGRV